MSSLREFTGAPEMWDARFAGFVAGLGVRDGSSGGGVSRVKAVSIEVVTCWFVLLLLLRTGLYGEINAFRKLCYANTCILVSSVVFLR